MLRHMIRQEGTFIAHLAENAHVLEEVDVALP
jgi:hypothetical protein